MTPPPARILHMPGLVRDLLRNVELDPECRYALDQAVEHPRGVHYTCIVTATIPVHQRLAWAAFDQLADDLSGRHPDRTAWFKYMRRVRQAIHSAPFVHEISVPGRLLDLLPALDLSEQARQSLQTSVLRIRGDGRQLQFVATTEVHREVLRAVLLSLGERPSILRPSEYGGYLRYEHRVRAAEARDRHTRAVAEQLGFRRSA
jgi:hypothetical protein